MKKQRKPKRTHVELHCKHFLGRMGSELYCGHVALGLKFMIDVAGRSGIWGRK
jgi:hypothetical protein